MKFQKNLEKLYDREIKILDFDLVNPVILSVKVVK